jgi:hypothetical protein
MTLTRQHVGEVLDGDTAIAEWEARFDDPAQGVRKRMREIAVLEFDGPLIASLREYWASERTGEPGTARARGSGQSITVFSRRPITRRACQYAGGG